jgi:hypothetical protein
MTTEATTETKKSKGAKAKGAKPAKGKGRKGAKKAKSRDKATTGQSAPHHDLPVDDLNDKEMKLVSVINGKGEGARTEITIPDLLKVFKSSAATKAQANSWVRNSLRRLVTGEFIEKTSRGVYRMTEKGRKRLTRAAA